MKVGGSPLFAKMFRWVNDRWPLDAVIRWSLEEEMPGGTSYAYVFGSCVFVVFLLQVITGVWQLLYFALSRQHLFDCGQGARWPGPPSP